MSKIISVAAGSKSSIEIEKPLGGVVINQVVGSAGVYSLANMVAQLKLVTVSVVTKQKRGGQLTHFNDVPLTTLADLHSWNEDGQCTVYQTGEDQLVRFPLFFSNTGALMFDNDEVLTLTIDNKSAGEFEAYSIESSAFGVDYVKLESVSVVQGQKDKHINTKKADTLIFPKSAWTADFRLELTHSNGVVVSYENLVEAEAIMDSLNPIAVNGIGSITSGACDSVILDLSTVTNMSMYRTTVTAFEFYFERNMLIKDLTGGARMNSLLTDTNDAERQQRYAKKVQKMRRG